LFRHIVDLDQYYDDLRGGTLPQVAYIAPAGGSEHPPRRPETGQTLVRSLVTALARSTSWPHSAFVWTYDEWGGWYDHVPPPAGRGFRVPALLVSPFARRGAVDGTTLEHASIPRFIEHNWGLRPLSRRDARANDITSAFDFAAPARAAEIVPATRAPDPDREPRPVGHLPLVRRGRPARGGAHPPRRPQARRGGAARHPGDRARPGPGPPPRRLRIAFPP
jgi:phospholipase C